MWQNFLFLNLYYYNNPVNLDSVNTIRLTLLMPTVKAQPAQWLNHHLLYYYNSTTIYTIYS
jgi:hypothetical protein